MELKNLLSWLNTLAVTWLVLALPALPLLWEVFANERYYPELMHESGELSAKLLVLALAITPIHILANGRPKAQIVTRWLISRRRAIGVAAFAYAAFHAYFYVRDTGQLDLVILQLEDPDISLGWLAFLAMLLPAAISNKFSLVRLGRRWKMLQRLAYFAAILTALHWVWLRISYGELIALTAFTLALQLVRVWKLRQAHQH